MKKDYDFDRFCNALGTWAEVFDKDLSEFAVAAYYQTLKNYPIEDVEKVISNAMGSSKFFPRPVELIELLTGSPQDIADRAEVEALKVLCAIRRFGGHKSVSFDDSTTAAVISQGYGGWHKLADMLESDSKWFPKDFSRIYQAFARQGIQLNGHLPGLHEIQNTANGFEFNDQPILIGNDAQRTPVPALEN